MVMGGDDQSLRMLRSGFGTQVVSPMATTAAWGFGSAHRDASQKLYMSPEQTKVMVGNNSQGPVYKVYEAIGPQPESKFNSAPVPGFGTSARGAKYTTLAPGPGTYVQEGSIGVMRESRRATAERAMFGTSTRDQQAKVMLDDELMKVNFGKESPGPCQYTKPGGMGKQSESQYATVPAFKQGTQGRFNDRIATKDFPGAGTYESHYNSVGKQALSSKVSLPTPKIGTSQRDASKKIFISREHEKCAYGEIGPGPASGPRVNAVGKQALSVKKSYPAYGFGTSQRSVNYDNGVPGPATYRA